MQWAVWNLLVKSGIRVLRDTKRYEVKMDQGFRKFFNTMCKRAKVDVTHKEMFMGHDIGLDDNYYRPEPEDLLPDYMKVVPFITFDDAEVLKVQNLKLSKELQKKEEQENRIKRLEEKQEAMNIGMSVTKMIASALGNDAKGIEIKDANGNVLMRVAREDLLIDD